MARRLKIFSIVLPFYKFFLGRRRIFKIRKKQAIELRKIGRLATLKIGTLKFTLDRSNLHDYMMLKILESGQYEPDVTNFITNNLRSGMTFIDLGANNGFYTLLAASIMGSSGRILSVEANPTVFERLRINVEQNGLASIVSMLNVAVSNFDGTADLMLDEFDEDGLASLYSVYERRSVGKIVVRKFDDVVQWKGIDIFKLDIEGGEIDALKGMYRTLHENPHLKIIMEWHFGYRSLDDFKYLTNRFEMSRILSNGEVRPIKGYEDLFLDNILLLQKECNVEM